MHLGGLGRQVRNPSPSQLHYGLYRYVPLWRVWFSSSLLWDRVYKSESLGLEEGIIFQETEQLVEDFSLGQGKLGIAPQKY